MQTYVDLTTFYLKFDLPPIIMLLLFSSPTHGAFLFSSASEPTSQNPNHLHGATAAHISTAPRGPRPDSHIFPIFGCFGHRPPILERRAFNDLGISEFNVFELFASTSTTYGAPTSSSVLSPRTMSGGVYETPR